jgi:hypothetical protein
MRRPWHTEGSCAKNKQINDNNWWESNYKAPHHVIFCSGDWKQLPTEGLNNEEVTGAFHPPSQAHIPTAAPFSHTFSVWTGFIWLRAGSVAGPCEQSNKP